MYFQGSVRRDQSIKQPTRQIPARLHKIDDKYLGTDLLVQCMSNKFRRSPLLESLISLSFSNLLIFVNSRKVIYPKFIMNNCLFPFLSRRPPAPTLFFQLFIYFIYHANNPIHGRIILSSLFFFRFIHVKFLSHMAVVRLLLSPPRHFSPVPPQSFLLIPF